MENNNSTLPLLHIISLVNSPFFININRDDILSRSFNDIGNTSHPTDEKFTKSLEKITFTEDQNELSCGICLEEFKKGDEAFVLPCKDQKHYFHVGNDKDNCEGILPWLKNNNTCPICREKFPEKNDDDDNLSSPVNDTDINDDINDIPIPEINFDFIESYDNDLSDDDDDDNSENGNNENINDNNSNDNNSNDNNSNDNNDNDNNDNDNNDINISINNIDSFLENILTNYFSNTNDTTVRNIRPRIRIINNYENDDEDIEFQQAIQRSLQER